MTARDFKQPKYRLNTASGRAFVQHYGKRHYLAGLRNRPRVVEP